VEDVKELTTYETLRELDEVHHSILSEEVALRYATTILKLVGLESAKDCVIQSKTKVKQLEDATYLHPLQDLEWDDPRVNGFVCTNSECHPKCVWTQDYLFSVTPFSAVKNCPVCGKQTVAPVHAFQKGEVANVVSGHRLVTGLVSRLGLADRAQPFLGTGYQHREYMRVLREFFHQERSSDDPCGLHDCKGIMRLVEEDHDENHPVFQCNTCGRTVGDE
jgi:hypothetical protein